MNKLGIRAHDVGTYDAQTLATYVERLGFDGVQLVLKKAITPPVDFNDLSAIKQAFAIRPKIFMLGAYFNPVHPDFKQVESGIAYFKKNLDIAKGLGCELVGSETGSFMGSPWGFMPQNHTDEALDTVIKVFKDLTKHAESNDVCVAVEGAWAHVASTPQRVKKLVDAVDSKHLKVIVDLYNFLNIDNYDDRMAIFDESIKLLKDKIVIFHLKDFIIEDEKLKQVGLGEGLMDYPLIIEKIRKHCPDAYLIFEGVIGDDITESFVLINNLLKKGKK